VIRAYAADVADALRGTSGSRRARRLAVIAIAAVFGLGSAHGVAAAAESDGPEDPPPLVIAHRGASIDAPEHTFAAYDRAVEQHADVLECDLQLTADDVLVCVHDTTVDRTTGGTATGRVDDYTLDELRAMDFGAWFGPEFAGETIVPFEEQLRCYREIDPDLQFYAETKAPAEYGGRMEPALVALLERLELIPEGPADPTTAPVIIQSFERPSLDAVKELAPSLPTAWLWVAPPAELTGGAAWPSTVDVMAPGAQYLQANSLLITQAHGLGREVHTWTVDDPAVMNELLAAGVDGIFTNDTAALRELVDFRTARSERPPVELERGCPDVAGSVTAVAATTAPPSTRAAAPVEPQTEPGAGSNDGGVTGWVRVVLIVLTIAAIVALISWAILRRRVPQ
jgi:glycerophosphoryl diester phosphodiesterase